ncbi:hypothetical protein FH972_014496 [Carpinus fangiana]|uniref:Uncharacterized protein n=1 Tax=Carpinus fangiana TaxID=176857 RepID=A0A5N6RAI6_9ROSI|nr:hypothetical protein FH972_014496 [Carpinus fangiana]
MKPESNRRRASSSSPSLDNSAQSTEEKARGRDGEMRPRKKERERGRVGFCDVVGGDSPAATGIFWVQGGDEREDGVSSKGKMVVDRQAEEEKRKHQPRILLGIHGCKEFLLERKNPGKYLYRFLVACGERSQRTNTFFLNDFSEEPKSRTTLWIPQGTWIQTFSPLGLSLSSLDPFVAIQWPYWPASQYLLIVTTIAP